MMTALKLVPNWAYGLLLAVALLVGAYLVGHSKGDTAGAARVQASWDAYKETTAKSEASAIAKRTAENTALAAKQATDNTAITKAHDEELAYVTARLAALGRLRKPAFCANSGPATTTEAQSTSSRNAADTTSGLLPDAVDGRVRSLIEETEAVAATGRACQATLRDNGMVE